MSRPSSDRGNHLRELKPRELRWTCDTSEYDLHVPESESRVIGIIGQERAIRAMKMGIELYSPGYNIFICGITGTGRTTTVKRILDKIKSSCPLPLDRCYIHNFSQPDHPRLLVLQRGRGREFRKGMERFRTSLPDLLHQGLEAEDHVKRRERIIKKHESEGDRLIERFEAKAEKEGFALKRIREGNISRPELFPLVQGQAVPVDTLEDLKREKKISLTLMRKLSKRYVTLHEELEAVAKESRKILEKMESEIAALDRAQARSALEEPVRSLLEKNENDTVKEFLQECVEHVTENLEIFTSARSARESGTDNRPPAARRELEDLLGLFEVNVVLDNVGRESCPVVIENLPTYRRLFGYFEKSMDRSGLWSTDFRRIRAGSLLKADGGYLVLNAEEVLRQEGIWQNLKRTLVNRALELHEEGTPAQSPVTTMRPEPIEINVKVILIGNKTIYNALFSNDPDFRKIFKVLADFDFEMDLNKKNLRQYAAFVGHMCHEEGLAHFDQGAVGAVAEFGARMAGRQGKLSARFGQISDLLREADYWRRKEGGSRVSARHVKTAIRAADQRNGLWEDKIQDLIGSGQILIEVKGKQVGQLNGLQVLDFGSHAFGTPARITATASPGTAGIINIEREAKYSGRAHDKGVLIVGGYFRERFGQDKPITFSASLTFEQSYSDVDGDSASSAEVFAILSSLSGLPLDQGIAVTGSVDQKGSIQPVGGINLKIEGYYRVCHSRGLNGHQGAIIPETNVRDLMLREEVVEAVRKKKFHIWPIRTIEEGIEILTGRPAGERGRGGAYPEDSVFGMVDRRLLEIARTVRRFSSHPGAPGPSGKT